MPGFMGNTGLVDHGDAKRKLAEALMMRQAQAPARPVHNLQSFLGSMVGLPQAQAAPREPYDFNDVIGGMIGFPEFGAMKRKKG